MLDDLAGHILLLSGHPGSGKTTSAEALACLPGVPKVHIHSDDFWGNIKHGHIDPWLPEANEQNRMVMLIAAGVAAQYADNGYFVVLDGVVRPSWLPAFQALKVPLHYIVLRTTCAEAVQRCVVRGGDSLRDPQVVADLHAEFSDLAQFERYVLPASGLDRHKSLESVITALQSGAYKLTVSV